LNRIHNGRSGKSSRDAVRGYARALAGAILFGFPLLMTMEMWWLGFYMDRERLFLFLVFTIVMLVPLSYFVGFERTGGLIEDGMDALIAFGIGVIGSAAMLAVFGIITFGMPAGEVIGKLAVQAVPASIGAILARGQLGSARSETKKKEQRAGYPGQLFIMAAGAVFLAFNVAPTEEMILIAYKMTYVHALALILLSIGMLHAFVFALDFRGSEKVPEAMGFPWLLVSRSIAGYGIALIISLYVLWTFGRTDGVSLTRIAMMTTVLGFPAALGAAAARVII
jgi:putative integral membrane protein (TIGR02587 family)